MCQALSRPLGYEANKKGKAPALQVLECWGWRGQSGKVVGDSGKSKEEIETG